MKTFLLFNTLLVTKRFKVQKTASVQTANSSKGFKQHQTMNKGLIKWNDRSFKKKQKKTKFRFYKHKFSPCSVLWCAFVTLLFELVHQACMRDRCWAPNGMVLTAHDGRGKRAKDLACRVYRNTTVSHWTLNRLILNKVHYMEKNPGMFSSNRLISWNCVCMTHQFVYPFLACYQHG